MTAGTPAESSATTQAIAYGSSRGRWVLLVAILGSGMAFLDGAVVNVALPTLGRDLDASTSSLQWIINGYQLTLASLILLGGSLGDRNGRRVIFVIGVGLFTVASALCAVAPTVEVLIGARVVQGVGGALLTPGSLAMIESSFRAAERPRAIGAWACLTAVATALGPLLGGYLVDAVSWRAVFLLNLPLGALVVGLAHHVPDTRDSTAHGHLDFRGAALAALALAGTTYALIEGPGDALSAPIVVTAVGGVAAFVAFLMVERRSPNPMMPLGMFSSRQFTAANLVAFVVYAAIGGFFFIVVSFLQISMGYSPLAAGAATLPVTFLLISLSPRAGALAQRIGPRIPLTVGPIVIAVGLLLLSGVSPGDSYVASVLPGVVVFGLGLTFVASSLTATVLAGADERHAGIASGIYSMVARVAQLVAVAVLPVVAGLTGQTFYDPSAMTDGFHIAVIVGASLAAAGGIIAWLTITDDALHAEPKRRGQAPVAVPTNYPGAARRRPIPDAAPDAA